MKIGTSLSRCVKDIYDGTVELSEVLVLVTRTNFDPEDDAQWKNIWDGYAGGNSQGSLFSDPEWSSIPSSDEDKIRDICIKLKKYGKLHQPRQYGARPPRQNHYWYDLVLTNDVLKNTPAAKKAWENYKLIAGLS